MEASIVTFFSFNEVFTVLKDTNFIPLVGDWVIALTNKSVVLPEDSLEADVEVVAAITCYEAVLYKRGDTSKPTWHGPSMDATKHRYYQIDPRNPDSHDYNPVSDPKVAIDPADPRLFALMTFVEGDGWVTTIMRPQAIQSLAHLAQLISGRVPLAMFLDVVGSKTSFSVKETLDIIHRFDVSMRHEYGIGPKERAMRLRIEG